MRTPFSMLILPALLVVPGPGVRAHPGDPLPVIRHTVDGRFRFESVSPTGSVAEIHVHFLPRATSARLCVHVERSDASLSGFDVYLDGQRLGIAGDLVRDVSQEGGPTGVRSTAWFPVESGLHPGLHRLTLVPRYERRLEDVIESGSPLAGRCEITRARTLDMTAVLRGWQQIGDYLSEVHRVLAAFDRAVRSRDRSPIGPLLGSEVAGVGRRLERLLADPAAGETLGELERMYFTRWREPPGVRSFLEHQARSLSELQAVWEPAWPMLAAGHVYRESKGDLDPAVSDLGLAVGNVRNACTGLLARAQGLEPRRLATLQWLLTQEVAVADALLERLSKTTAAVDAAVTALRRKIPAWKRTFHLAHRTILASIKSVPRDYPSDGRLDDEIRALEAYFECVRDVTQLEITFAKMQIELVRSLIDPEVARQGALPPRRIW